MKIKKGIPLIDQHDKNFLYGGKFGGNFIPETLKKPIDDLTNLFAKLRRDKKFLKVCSKIFHDEIYSVSLGYVFYEIVFKNEKIKLGQKQINESKKQILESIKNLK